MSDSTVINTEKSYIDLDLNAENYSGIDLDLNAENHSGIDFCEFQHNDGTPCLYQAVDFICGYCTKKFCLDHLTEHEKERERASRLNVAFSNSNSNVNHLINTATSSSSSTTCTSSCCSCTCSTSRSRTTCTSSCCSCTCSTSRSRTTCSQSVKSTLISEESALTFRPVYVSTPADSATPGIMPRREISENINHDLSTIHFTNVIGSTMNHQPSLIHIPLVESMEIPSATIASNDLFSTLESTLIEKSNNKKRKKTLQSESSIKEDDDRFNRSNFCLKNIGTSMTYMDVFISLATTYPLVQLNTTENLPKIQYLCVADTSASSNEKFVSIHLCFQKKVNFKHKFLNNLFSDLKKSDYVSITNGDQFNAEIKLLANEKYIESSMYATKKGKNVLTDAYHQKQNEVACAAFQQKSLRSAIDVMKNHLPYAYATLGANIRLNMEYELQEAKKQEQIDYKPAHDSTSFKIPEEHREKIDEWLKNDFQKRINGEITRSRCLFMVGPTKHGI